MTWYCYWSPYKKAPWNLTLSSERDNIVAAGKAEFITALDLDCDVSDTDNDAANVRYRGDFYLDFDSDRLDETISKVNEFLDHLISKLQMNLDQVRFFASGQKGFHIEIPQACFLPKPSPTGYARLPYIYREMAYDMYTDTLDLNVYTAKKGRMWRVCNFKRETGTYKVQITAEEARKMTVERYKELVSSPRPCFPTAAPTLCPKLATLFATSRDKVDNKARTKKKGMNLLACFDGKVPPSLDALMQGENIVEKTGFQKIAMQLAISAHGFKIGREDFIARCKGLCEKHVGDGDRYRSVFQREHELGRMWDYMHDNPQYEFSTQAVSNLISVEAPDLKFPGISVETPALAAKLRLRVDRSGIWKELDNGSENLCPMGFDDPLLLQDTRDKEDDKEKIYGYDVAVYLDNNYYGRRSLPAGVLTSASTFKQFVSSIRIAGCQVTDQQVEGIKEILRRMAEQKGEEMFVIHREGLSMPVLPDGRQDIVWLENNRVVSRLGQHYVFRSEVHNSDDLPFATDLMQAPRIPLPSVAAQEGVEYLSNNDVVTLRKQVSHLLQVNSDETIAKALGWSIACFICPALRLLHDNQFPLLHLYGSAGTGKSSTARLLTSFHWHKTRKPLLLASTSTPHIFNQHAAGSSSLPLVIDEYKKSDMNRQTENYLETLLKGSFDAGGHGRGRISRSSGASQVVSDMGVYVAPCCFISEQCDNVEAKLHRSIVVPLTSHDSQKGTPHFKAIGNTRYFSSIGRLIVETLIFSDDVSPRVIDDKVREYEEALEVIIPRHDANRQRYGIAVAATGLWLFKEVLSMVWGSTFNDRMDELQNTLLNPPEVKRKQLVYSAKSETVQVLEIMSTLSNLAEAPDTQRLIYGSDYVIGPDYMDIKMMSAFMKYQVNAKATGSRPLFSSAIAFASALNNYPGASQTTESPLSTHGVYRFNTEHLYGVEGVAPFKESSQ